MIYSLSITYCSKLLSNLRGLLVKAQTDATARKFDVANLLNARLAPDQFNLIQQVRVACDIAKLGAARLTDGMDSVPRHADDETTLDELLARIDSVLDYLASLPPAAFDEAADRIITMPRTEGKTITGENFLRESVVPNVGFHTSMAYAILRHNGVPLGKKDYLGELSFQN